MIKIERSAVAPASLSSVAANGEADKAKAHYAIWTIDQPRFEDFTHYNSHDVKLALREDFHWKCAYCERQVEKGSFDVEHYRPKGKVDGCDHPGYWWLALDWNNLLPSCPACNQSLRQEIVTSDMTEEEVEALRSRPPRASHGKGIQFPVTGQRLAAPSHDHGSEGALIIDPTRTDPEPHLHWRFDDPFSKVDPKVIDGVPSASGRATIDCLALNRTDLIQLRTAILRRFKIQRLRILKDLKADADAGGDSGTSQALETALRRIEDMKDATRAEEPFAGMARAFVAQLAAEITEWALAQGLTVDPPD